MFTFEKKELSGDTVIALGSFDGLHYGHMRVLENALQLAEEMQCIPTVLLFDVHPKKYLKTENVSQLVDEKKRDEMLGEMGFRIVKADFSKIRDLSPMEFLLAIYCKLNVRGICCGFNYRFGKFGAGDVTFLESECVKLGIRLSVGEAVLFEGETVSSSRIRNAIKNGEVAKANEMLGHCFSFRSEVLHGDARGATMGFPTLNQRLPEGFIIPRFGVYASKVFVGGNWYASVTNIGIRPMFETKICGAETHIIGFDGDLYGAEIEVFLLEFIRDEMKFESVEKLIERIRFDSYLSSEIYKKYENT